jgi:hypothetical protein
MRIADLTREGKSMGWGQRKSDGEVSGDTCAEGAAPVRPLGRDVWLTRDGRELRIADMYRPHLGNAQAILTKWLKVEKDPVKRRELKSWRSRMRRELVKREKAWQAKRKERATGEASPQRSRNGFSTRTEP